MIKIVLLIFFTQFQSFALDLSLKTGWNLITGVNGLTNDILNEHNTVNIILSYNHGKWLSAYQSESVNIVFKKLETLTLLSNNHAYYLHVKSDTTLTVSEKVDTNQVVLQNGWNLVAGINKSFNNLVLQYPKINKIYHLHNGQWQVAVNSKNTTSFLSLASNEPYWIQYGSNDIDGAIFEQSIFGISLFQ